MQQNKSFIKLALTLVIGIALAGCNGGNNTTTNNTVVTSSLQAYINSLAYTPAKTKQLTTSGGTKQQSFTTPGGLTINSVDIKFYSGESCTGTLVQTQTLNSDLAHPVTPTAGTYSSTSASNNALCGNYQNGANNGCSVLYADMSAGRMRSMQYTYNLDNGAGGSVPVVAGCMYNANAVVTMGEDSTTGVEGIANWTDQTTSVACSGGTCGFSQAYNVTLTPPAVISVSATYSSWDNSQTGGTLTDPLLLHYIGNNLPMAFIDLTYTNTGNGAANNFTSTLATLPNGWSLRTHGCNAATLAATNGTCTDQYKFIAPQDIHVTGTEFNNGNVKLSWNDGTPHESQVLTLRIGTAGVGGYNTANVIYNAVYLDMFVSTAAHNGQFSSVVGGNDAIANADILCTGDAQNTLVGTIYKALLVAESSTPTLANSRYACTTQACTVGESYNWVLQSNLRYSSLSNFNQIIGMTNASSIFPNGANLSNIFTNSAKYIWTGLATSDATSQAQGYYNWMTTYPGFTNGPQISPVTPTTRGNCNNWTSNATYNTSNPNPLDAGNSSKGNQSGYNAFAQSSQGCNDNGNKHYLLCVQQP